MTSPITDKDELKKAIREIFCDQLAIEQDELDDDTDFLQIGLDSVSAAQLVVGLSDKLGEDMTMPTEEIYEHRTINQLTDHLFNLFAK